MISSDTDTMRRLHRARHTDKRNARWSYVSQRGPIIVVVLVGIDERLTTFQLRHVFRVNLLP